MRPAAQRRVGTHGVLKGTEGYFQGTSRVLGVIKGCEDLLGAREQLELAEARALALLLLHVLGRAAEPRHL